MHLSGETSDGILVQSPEPNAGRQFLPSMLHAQSHPYYVKGSVLFTTIDLFFFIFIAPGRLICSVQKHRHDFTEGALFPFWQITHIIPVNIQLHHVVWIFFSSGSFVSLDDCLGFVKKGIPLTTVCRSSPEPVWYNWCVYSWHCVTKRAIYSQHSRS